MINGLFFNPIVLFVLKLTKLLFISETPDIIWWDDQWYFWFEHIKKLFDYCLTNKSKSIMYEISTATWATIRFSIWCIVKKIIRWTRYQLRKKMLSQDSWYASVSWRPIKTTSQIPFMELWKEILECKDCDEHSWSDVTRPINILYCYKDLSVLYRHVHFFIMFITIN